MIQVNVCHGWGCNLVTKCARSDFNYLPQPGHWSRHYHPPHTGEACEDFEPLHPERYGIGKDSDHGED